MFERLLFAFGVGVNFPLGVKHSSSPFFVLKFERSFGVFRAIGDFFSFLANLLVGVFILLLKEALFSLSSRTNLETFLNSKGKDR